MFKNTFQSGFLSILYSIGARSERASAPRELPALARGARRACLCVRRAGSAFAGAAACARARIAC